VTAAGASAGTTSRPRLLVTYHFFHPDNVVSARIFADFAEEQRRRGWDVTALTSNRLWEDPTQRLPAREDWQGVDVRRLFRPPFDQARPAQRLLNSAWMVAGWLARTITLGRFDAVVIGSDPAFAALLAIPLRRLRPRLAIAHWCFDLYPEAIDAEGLRGVAPALRPAAERLMHLAYRSCDAVVDIGPGMRKRLDRYDGAWRRETITPWALVEPHAVVVPDPAARRALFGDARLALLYAGTMGRAHDFEAFLALARRCRARAGNAIRLCFASRGNRQHELRAAVGPEDTNVSFTPFTDEAALPARLAAADIHLLSLQPEWAGLVVPSKFFASLAVGRPVLYAGPATSEIATWVREHQLGLVLDPAARADIDATVDRLVRLADDPARLGMMQATALSVYRTRFAKDVANDRWNRILQALFAAKRGDRSIDDGGAM
jgi:colanic acid biosynthesis glycosyl transferase WcaI